MHLPHLYFPLIPLVVAGTLQLFLSSLLSASLQPLPSVGLKREKNKVSNTVVFEKQDPPLVGPNFKKLKLLKNTLFFERVPGTPQVSF
jgi:hypothetical protein